MTDRLAELLTEAIAETVKLRERLERAEAQRDAVQRELAAIRAVTPQHPDDYPQP